MPLTGHDILMNADLFRAAYPRWPSAETPDPLAGPFPTGRELTDYSDDPGYAVSLYPSRPAPETSKTAKRIASMLAAGEAAG